MTSWPTFSRSVSDPSVPSTQCRALASRATPGWAAAGPSGRDTGGAPHALRTASVAMATTGIDLDIRRPFPVKGVDGANTLAEVYRKEPRRANHALQNLE